MCTPTTSSGRPSSGQRVGSRRADQPLRYIIGTRERSAGHLVAMPLPMVSVCGSSA